METKLSVFLQKLFEDGSVTVSNQITAFRKTELEESSRILQQYYAWDRLEMPDQAPDFHPKAALWAAGLLYRAIQLIMLRELDDAYVVQHIDSYPEKQNPEITYSVDLTFRHLPRLFGLAKGLAPDDILVKRLNETALNWPLSSVGMNLEGPFDLQAILGHPSLRQAYIDRIITKKDKNRLQETHIQEGIREALGIHLHTFWPEFESLNKHHI